MATIEADWEQLVSEIEDLAETLEEDISIAAAIDQVIDGEPMTPAEQRALAWSTQIGIVLEEAAEADDVSLLYPELYLEVTGEQHLIGGGFDQVTDGLAVGLDVRTGEAVELVDATGSEVTVHTTGAAHPADRVVITVPIGVLKEGSIAFLPALPGPKLLAVDRLGTGALNKIVLSFASAFWPAATNFLGYMSDPSGRFPDFVDVTQPAGPPTLLGFVGGDFATGLGGLSDGEIVQQVMATLNTMLGPGLPPPTGSLVTRWLSDPYSRGSFSHVPVGATDADLAALAAPVADRLFFAGEATSPNRSGTIEGAYTSGLREADRILGLTGEATIFADGFESGGTGAWSASTATRG